MTSLVVSVLISLSFFLTTTTQRIEQSFLGNDPGHLYALFPPQGHISVSLPEPISFSDQLSNQQAFFLFQRLFDSYETFVFYTDRQSLNLYEDSLIMKARWSFRDKKNNNLHVFHIYFYLSGQPTPGGIRPFPPWKIIEIKAEKI